MIRSAARTTLCSLLGSYLVAELNQTVIDVPQLAKEVQPLLGLFHNELNLIVPLQFLGDGGAQEPE